MRCSGWPANFVRSSGSWVAMPTEQVLRWHFRSMMQPRTISGAVAASGGDVAAGLELAVGLDDDAASEVVQDQDLLRLRDAKLPGQAGVLDRRLGRGAGAAAIAADQDDVAVALRHAGGDGADAVLGNELHVDAGPRVGVLQVVDELGEVLDRVDVVVGRRRDKLDAGRG